MTTVTLDIALFVVYSLFLFGAGWEAESWRLGSKHAVELQAEINATNAAEKKADNVATGFEDSSRKAREEQDQLLEKWRIADAKPHTVCLLSDNSLGLLHTATAQGRATR